MITLSALDRKDALRYMGSFALSPDYMTNQLMDKAENQILKTCRPSYTFTEIQPDSSALGGEDIKRVVSNCQKIILVAATLGIYVDKLMRKIQVTDMAQAVAFDAMASVAIEQFMDKIEVELKKRYPTYFLTPRFSPGYGDYPIEKQREIIKILNTEKKLGLSLTDSFMLNPTKSVTAVIGLSQTPGKERNVCISKCDRCDKKDCPYRKETK